jgi:hypothetical protein
MLSACTPQLRPGTQGNADVSQLEKTLSVSNNASGNGDETSLLATEIIDPEANETSVTIIVRPQPSEDTVVSSLAQYLYPDSFIGIPALEMQRKIGSADFIRQEGAVVTWQYRMPSCVIDFYILFETTEIGSIHNLPSDKVIDSRLTRSRIHNLPLNEIKCLEEFTGRHQ